MGRIRPLTRSDLPAIAALEQRTFLQGRPASAAAQIEKLDRIFFQNPWIDLDLPSLVYEDATGVCGFMGIVPRPVVYRGEVLRLAVGTRFMVAPERRGVVGVRLLREYFNGPQDISISDVSNSAGAQVWNGLGGRPILLFNLFWLRALRPARHGIGQFGRGTAVRAARFAMRPLLNGIDALVTRWGGSPYRLSAPVAVAEIFNPTEVLSALPELLGAVSLRPHYDKDSLAWLLDRVGEKHGADILQRVQVREASGSLIGWYLYLSNAGGLGEVVQIAARPGRRGEVLDHLFHHAWQHGHTAIAGRMEPTFAEDLRSRRCSLTRDGPWFVAQTRRPEILQDIERGDILFSRLEGEWWMNFK